MYLVGFEIMDLLPGGNFGQHGQNENLPLAFSAVTGGHQLGLGVGTPPGPHSTPTWYGWVPAQAREAKREKVVF